MSPARKPAPFDDEMRKLQHDAPRGGAEEPDVGEEMREKPMTLREAGRRGGERRRAELGSEGYAELGRKGGEAVKAKYGPEWYREIGRRGGRMRVEQSKLAARGGDPSGLNFQPGATEGSAGGPARAHDRMSEDEEQA